MTAGSWLQKNGQTFHASGVDARTVPCHTLLMTTTTAAKAIETTDALWERTHKALCEGRWSEARALLDDLSLRTDVRDMLRSAASYGLAGHWIEPVIQGRIDLVNSRVA